MTARTPSPLDERTIPKLSMRRLLQASGSLQFRFDELGLEINGGFSAGSFNGTADITYWNDDDNIEWFVHDITLDCHKWNGGGTGSGRWDVKQITLEQHTDLYIAIWSVLTDGGHKDSIEAKVMEQL